MKILIVDDSKANALLLLKYLQVEGYSDVSYVLSALEALDVLNKSLDLILMDVMMPEMDGIEAVQQVRKSYNPQQLPIVMVTAADQVGYLKSAFDAGANDYVSKPVNRVEFLARVKNTLDLKRQYDRRVHYERILENTLEEQRVQITAMETTSSGIIIADHVCHVEWMNHAAEELLGYTLEELLSTNLMEHFAEQDRLRVYQQLAQNTNPNAIQEQATQPMIEELVNYYNRNQQQRIAKVSCTSLLVTVHKQKLQKLVLVVHDVTEQESQRIQLENELELAKQIQKNLLPAPMDQKDIQINGYIEVSNRLSGDFYYWHQISESQYGVIIIDVMGHGVSSSLVGMTIRSLLPGIISRIKSPTEVMLELNRHMISLYQSKAYIFACMDYYFTAIYVLIDTEKDMVRYVNSGHPVGILVENCKKFIKLDTGSPPIGLLSQLPMKEAQLSFPKGSRLVLYSDGLLALLPQNYKWQIGILTALIQKSCGKPYGELLDSILRNPENIKENASRDDDITLVVIDRK